MKVNLTQSSKLIKIQCKVGQLQLIVLLVLQLNSSVLKEYVKIHTWIFQKNWNTISLVTKHTPLSLQFQRALLQVLFVMIIIFF